MNKQKRQSESPAVKAMRSLTQKDAAWLIGMTDRQLRNCPDCPRLPGGKYDAQQVVAWHIARQATDDPMQPVTGETTPAMERWRRARAAREETELLVRLKELDSRTLLWAGCEMTLAPVRHFAETLIQRYGDAVKDEWDDVIALAGKELDARLGPPDVRRELLFWPDGETEPIKIDLNKLGDYKND